MRVRFTREWRSPNRVRHHQPGEIVNVSNALAARLLQQGVIELVDRPEPADMRETTVSLEQYHVGGGWYQIPGVDKKLRRQEAEHELRG